jgi:hypothetical protein
VFSFRVLYFLKFKKKKKLKMLKTENVCFQHFQFLLCKISRKQEIKIKIQTKMPIEKETVDKGPPILSRYLCFTYQVK